MSTQLLSQRDVDALLANVGAREEAAGLVAVAAPAADRRVKPYDFRHPDKFSKEHMRAIENIHGTFARTAANALGSYLRAGVTIQLRSVEQVVHEEYLRQLSRPTIMHLLEMQPLTGRLVLEMHLPLAVAMLDRMMGAPAGPTRAART